MKIEGSNVESSQCEAEPQLQQAQQSAPVACVNRVEQAKVEERQYAGERGTAEEQLFQLFSSMPPHGALELELSGKAATLSAKARVTAERDADGDFLVRVQGGGSAGVGAHATVSAGGRAAATYRVRTAEAAADLVDSLASTALMPQRAALQTGDALKSAHYAAAHLERVELTGEGDLHVAAGLALVTYGAAEVAQQWTAAIDLNEGKLIVDQGVSGEVMGRASNLLSRAGVEGEAAFKLRTETKLPRETLERLQQGELSVPDVLLKSQTTHKLMVEVEQRAEVGLLTVGSPAQVAKFEGELDLHELFSNPTEPGRAVKGELKLLTTANQSRSVGYDMHGLNVLGRAAVYQVATTHLFQGHDALQQEVDARRTLGH